MNDIDRRTLRGRELAKRLNEQTILDKMPKIWFVDCGDHYRVGRTDWPGDVFNSIHPDDFATFRKIYDDLQMPLIDSYDD